MKKITTMLMGAILGLTLLSAGCAGNRYERSTGESIDDTSTTARVKSALRGDSMFKYPDVDVSTFKGTVQLSGFVANGEQKDRATQIAKTVDGVREIKNDIAVKP